MDLLLDSNNDIDLTNNLITLTSTTEKLTQQRLNIKLHTNQREWKFNISFGLPWITEGDQLQLSSKADKGYMDGVIQKAILETDHVLEILQYESHLDNTLRINSILATVRCENGEITTLSLEG